MSDYYGDIERRARIVRGGRRVVLDEETGRMRAIGQASPAFEDPPDKPRRKRRVKVA